MASVVGPHGLNHRSKLGARVKSGTNRNRCSMSYEPGTGNLLGEIASSQLVVSLQVFVPAVGNPVCRGGASG